MATQGQPPFIGPEEAALDADLAVSEKAHSPIKLEVLEKWLQNYNIVDALILWAGFKYGFRLSYEGERLFS